MGTSTSSLKELQDNEYLQLFVAKGHISTNDPFWNGLLSFTFVPPHNCADYRLLQESVQPMLNALPTNNAVSGNVVALVQVFLTHSAELKESVLCENEVFVYQTFNALFILRTVLKFFIETSGEEGMLKQLCDNHDSGMAPEEAAADLLDNLINALVEIVVGLSLNNLTFAIIVEAASALLVLLSVQMFSSSSSQKSLVYKTIMLGKCSLHSNDLVKILLSYYIKQDECPHCLKVMTDSSNIISGFASGIWKMITGENSAAEDAPSRAILANRSQFLLLTLVNHCTNESDIRNPYREALFLFHNSNKSTSDTDSDTIPSFELDFDALFNTLCNTLTNDQTTLLVYVLLHKNPSFKQYVRILPNIHTLVLPILKILYFASDKNSHHIYMALIILLILSEDEQFDKNIHKVKVETVTWYTARPLPPRIALGGFIILILSRTITYNMSRMHDKYLHTNCLAALANMSAHFDNLHPFVCQKLIGLLEYFTKRRIRQINKFEHAESFSAEHDAEDSLSSDLGNDIAVLEEVIRMLLEILNSCLSNKLTDNLDLVYTMMYNRNVFTNLHTHSIFADIMQNIETIITYFSGYLDDVNLDASVLAVHTKIQDATVHWPSVQLRRFPELRFRYVEEGQPDDFFIPYLWTLVYNASDMYWNPSNIFIFTPATNLESR